MLKVRFLLQGSAQLYIRATHTVGDFDKQLDLTDDILIDDIYIEIENLTSFSPPTPPEVFTGEGGRAEAEQLQFGVDCDGNWYGPFCDMECHGRDDSGGHYQCNQDGVRECLEGYQNLETNCTECAPADGCSKSCIYFVDIHHKVRAKAGGIVVIHILLQ